MRRAIYGNAFLATVAIFVACGGDEPGGGADPANGGEAGAGGGEAGGGGGEGGATDGSTPDEPFTPTYGRFGVPEVTFTIPMPAGTPPAISLPDIQATYPAVDWTKLDRLYIPAGVYRSILIGGLPSRAPTRPLVITNLGGQVKIGGFAGNHLLVLQGGQNWILTGRYDPTSRTGDAGFRGHAEGAFKRSQGTYGIFIDDAFSKVGLSGIAVGAKASDFELEMLEVARAEFAGITAKTDNDGAATMRNVKLHDTYIHDVGSEGIYFGSTQPQPQHAFENLHVHDNRILRAGTEALQVGQLGSGCEVEHNVLGPGAVRWRSAFADYQNGNVQYGQRYGSSSFHHNVVLGTGDLFVELFPTVVAGDTHAAGDTITFADNYFADTSSSGVFTHADGTGVNVRFERNTFRGFRFTYDQVYPGSMPPVGIFAIGAGTTNPHVLADNVVDGPYPFFAYTPPANATLTNNTKGTIARVVFRDFMNAAIDEDYRGLEWWTDRATRTPGEPKPVVTYAAKAHVVHDGVIYEAIAQNAEKKPNEHPEAWKALAPPSDDVRLAAGSPYAMAGLRWPPPK
jgi:hypothetical protein